MKNGAASRSRKDNFMAVLLKKRIVSSSGKVSELYALSVWNEIIIGLNGAIKGKKNYGKGLTKEITGTRKRALRLLKPNILKPLLRYFEERFCHWKCKTPEDIIEAMSKNALPCSFDRDDEKGPRILEFARFFYWSGWYCLT